MTSMYTNSSTAGSQWISRKWTTNNATQIPSAIRFSRRINRKVFFDSNRLIASTSGHLPQVRERLAAGQDGDVTEEPGQDRDGDALDDPFRDRVHDPGHALDAEVPRHREVDACAADDRRELP